VLVNLLTLLLTSQAPLFGECMPVYYQGDTLDIGYCAAPLLTDWNQDGLIDIILGCRFPTSPFSGPCGCMFYFPNMGSPSTPLFDCYAMMTADGVTLSTST